MNTTNATARGAARQFDAERIASPQRFTLLGPVRAWRGSDELDLGSPQQRVVLAALLLQRGRPVTTAALVDAVWGDDPPATAVAVLRTYVSRLRKVLEAEQRAAEPPQVIVSVADGYRAHVSDALLDLGVFEQQVSTAKNLRAAGDMPAAAEVLHAALDLWEGAALAGLPGPLAETERSRLAEIRLAALENRLDIDLQLGQHSEVIPELTALIDEYPFREELCRLLMLALYRSGRRAEALARYRRMRGILVTELGIEPGAPLRELHERMLTADTSIDHRSPDNETPKAEPVSEQWVSPAQLPADLLAFTGRQAELRQSQELLPSDGKQPSTVVISAIGGMAGIGKTTLAVHWAHSVAEHYPDGQLFINLRGYDAAGSAVSPQDAVRVFLEALGVPEQRLPASPDAQTALYRSLLARRRVLIVLDNARDTNQVRPLLPGSPGCLVIVTSRSRLTGLVASEGAHPLVLSSLTAAEGCALLARRIGNERLSKEPGAAEEIVRLCGGLPLALAVVAARLATNPGFSLTAVVDELHESRGSLDAFASADIVTDVRAVFSWSYEVLTEGAARLFYLLSLHVGPEISAPAAAALVGLSVRQARSLLTELTGANLLTECLPGRYILHDLLRVYADEQLHAYTSADDREQAVDRLLAWYEHSAAAAYRQLTPHRRKIPLRALPPDCHPLTFSTRHQALNWCDIEQASLVGAVHQAAASGRPGSAWRLNSALWSFFYLRGRVYEWLDTSRTALAAARSVHDRTGEVWCLSNVATALTMMRQFNEAIEYFRRTMVLSRELGDVDGRALAVANLGNVYLQLGQLEKAVEYTRRTLALSQIRGDAWQEGICLVNLGDAYQRLSRFDEAVDNLEQGLSVLRATGNRWVEGVTLDILGTLQHRLQQHEAAVERFHQALEAHRDVGNRWVEGDTLGHLGAVLQDVGRTEEARGCWQQALDIFEELNHPDAQKARENLRRLEEGLTGERQGGCTH
ncbi:BTAD domain-containing putative transcriptional regulator [Streptomyces sp. NPDC049744]|uniref:AfsR/SARP family transcriptional regulator n=1 Tax=Streptomyces sp. NPDC049744 TaxID=3154359 RepID=UPI003419AEEC